MGYSSAIVVEGLDANRNVTRTLTLRGGGLPHMGGAHWGIETSMSTTFYANNPKDGTQQFTVAKEMPSSWSGEWNLTRLNRAPCSYSDSGGSADVVSPGFLIDVFEDMAIKGQLLRVTWAVDSDDPSIKRSVSRIGRISKFNAVYTRSMDVSWEVTFAWKSRGGVLSRVANTREGGAGSASASIVAAQLALNALVTQGALFSSNPSINLSATQFSLGQLENLVNAPLVALQSFTNSIGRLAGQIGQVVGIINQAKSLPAALESTVVGLSRNVVQQSNQYADELSATPPEQLTLSHEAADLAKAMQYFGQAHDQAEATSSAAQQTISKVLTAAARPQNAGDPGVANSQTMGSSGVLTTYRVRHGDTPARVSMIFFGTPDQDVAILRANNLPWYQATFDVGTMLVIPVASQQPSNVG